ncbi:hypothetical protein C8Q79DRAFT_914327 [Trametes meyenii]|nr:hypothetical protein C8Q79DRAFT_914327 [Trametes meyenii]
MLNPLPPYGQPHSSLLVVHDDVFFQVLDNVQKSGTLRALSETCRDIRIRCLPLLFCRCTVASHIPVARRFPPQTLWPYFKHLRLVDRCKDIEAEYWDVPLQFAQDPMLCGIYDGPFLENALQSMPRLSSVTFHLDTDGIHGLPWPVIAAVLSVPCLQEFRITAFLLCPKTLSTETISLHHPIPLTRLTYQLYDTRLGSRSWPTEKQALASILANTCTTLEKLTIPTEAAPFKYLSSARFPALRELHLRGDYRTTGSPPLSYVQVFANMPRLRYLDLRLGQVFDDPVPPLWPPGLDVPFPWPELEHITISHPVVNDRIYANLPPSLRSLTLRSFPHFATSVWMYGLNNSSGDRWSNFELLPASQMELIVRKLRLPSLEGLEIEYQEDGAEDDLLQYITSTFQTMTTITIRRARREDSPDISIVSAQPSTQSNPAHTGTHRLHRRTLGETWPC